MCVSNLEATEVHGFENYGKRHILSVPSWRLRLFGLFLFIMAKSINLALYTFFFPSSFTLFLWSSLPRNFPKRLYLDITGLNSLLSEILILSLSLSPVPLYDIIVSSNSII